MELKKYTSLPKKAIYTPAGSIKFNHNGEYSTDNPIIQKIIEAHPQVEEIKEETPKKANKAKKKNKEIKIEEENKFEIDM